MIDQILDNSALPMLEKVMAFSEQRQNVLLDNLANIDTPGYRMNDLPVQEFTAALDKALQRQEQGGRFEMENTEHLTFRPTMQARPAEIRGLMNYYDGANRSVERMMGELSKNALWHNIAAELYRSQTQLIRTAIRERV